MTPTADHGSACGPASPALALLLFVWGCCAATEEAILYPAPPGHRPGPAQADLQEGGAALTLRNKVLEARWSLDGRTLRPERLTQLPGGSSLYLPRDAFVVRLGAGKVLRSGELVASPPTQVSPAAGSQTSEGPLFRLSRLHPDPEASQAAMAEFGWRAELNLTSADGELEVRWTAELRDGAGYVRLAVELVPLAGPLALKEVVLFDGEVEGSGQVGRTSGVPVAAGSWFLGYEHPQAKNAVTEGQRVRCALSQERTLEPGRGYRASMVLGVVAEGQLRRSFWHYLERERAHPTRPMLHYNTWYDIGTGEPFSAKDALQRLEHVCQELASRGVQLDAFLLDDGWDDPDSGPWQPHAGFSNESLTELEQRAAHWGTGLGVWFSPFGGYHEPRQRRLAAARRAGIEVREEARSPVKAVLRARGACSKERPCQEGEGDCNSDEDCAGGLACFQTERGVSPPGVDASAVADRTSDFCFDPAAHSAFFGLGIAAYYRHLLEAISRWVLGGARLLKLDGVGNPAGHDHTSAHDFDAAVALIADLRRANRRIFINLSTGTWPSPFWLLSSDTVWRQGHDHYFAGVGPPRERWMTYRDAMVYKHNVQASPLFPLNSLMVHGIIFAKDAWDLNEPEGMEDMSESFRHEVRSAFGSGSMLQELYITPSLLNRGNWDDLAQAALWVRPRMPTLADTHWFGGDPELGQVYGWSAWRDAEREGEAASAVLTIRNPAETAQEVLIEAGGVFELPRHARGASLVLGSPFADQRPRRLALRPGYPVPLRLAPFAVLVFDSAAPRPSGWEEWSDYLGDNAALLFWLCAGSLAGLWTWWGRTSAAAAPAPVPMEEVRRRRLAALEQRSGASSGGAAGEGLRLRGGGG